MELKNHLEEIAGKKVLVLGGLGFVGHNLVNTLVTKFNCHTVCLDNCKNSNVKSVAPVMDKIELVIEDIRNLDKWKHLLSEVDYVFHLACIQIAHSALDPIEDLEVNAKSVLEILHYIKNNNLENVKRFIYTSSCSIYGYSNKLPVSENDPINPISHYAATKYLGERYTLNYNLLYNIPTSSVRYSNIYGYGQTPNNPYCGVLGKFVHQACHGLPLTVIGDGEQTRDYTFVDDAVQATILAACHPKALGNVFNVATCSELSVNQLVHLLQKHFPNIETLQLPERDIDNIRRRVIDIEKIRQTLGWNPAVPIEKGIAETIKNYMSMMSNAYEREGSGV